MYNGQQYMGSLSLWEGSISLSVAPKRRLTIIEGQGRSRAGDGVVHRLLAISTMPTKAEIQDRVERGNFRHPKGCKGGYLECWSNDKHQCTRQHTMASHADFQH